MSDKAEPKDMVNNPAHYGGADNPYEHVKVALALGWERNAFIYTCTKYLWRFNRKSEFSVVEDLKKARWYLDREIERQERLEAQSQPVLVTTDGRK